ncbi:MAG: NERD domain-containing protein [Lachnospiraceae bacterium]|nr:NERD domain-containing protein [Lachnospiraceae bacterium]
MSILIVFVIGFALWYGISAYLYGKTDYAKTTHKSFASVRFNKGFYGEYLTYKYLRKYEDDGAKFLYNCYLPKENGQTTEIDVLMIHTSGIYVFESKNYSGWIFGSEYQKTWTQTLPSGRKSHKEHFLNPIMQNKLHIKWLQNQIGENSPVHSIIVFSERCTLKKVEVSSSNIHVINRNRVKITVDNIAAKTVLGLSATQVVEIYDKLFPFTQVSDEIKQKHVQDIVEAHIVDTVSETATAYEADLVCPKCGGKLKLKTTMKGPYAGSQFYGCSNFPNCRYIKNI